MKIISAKSLATALTVATLSFSAASTSFAADDAKALLATAKTETDKATKAGHGWTIWKKMFKQAEEAIKDGKDDKAAKIAKAIASQGLAAQKQAEAGKSAGSLMSKYIP